jgi:hypothetical protein
MMRISLRYQVRPTEVLEEWSDLDRDLVMAYWSLFPEYDTNFSTALIAASNFWSQGHKMKVQDLLPKVSKPLNAEET